MFHTAVYHQNKDTAGALARINPVLDQVLTQQNNAFIVPRWGPNIGIIYPLAQQLAQVQMQSPKMRETSEIDVPQFDQLVTPPDLPSFLNIMDNPRELDIGEGLECFMAEGAAGAVDLVTAIWLLDKIDPVPEGDKEIIRATATFTSTAYAWTLAPLVLGQQLRAGEYAITNVKIYSATGIVGRLVLEEQKPRPGVIVQQNETRKNFDDFDCPNLGSWGTFYSTFLPQLEIFTQGIDTSATVYLEVVKIGELAA